MKPLLKPSSHSNLYHATMRPPSFGRFLSNQRQAFLYRRICTGLGAPTKALGFMLDVASSVEVRLAQRSVKVHTCWRGIGYRGQQVFDVRGQRHAVWSGDAHVFY